MKRLIISIVALLLALAICFSGYYILTKTCNELSGELENIILLIQSDNRDGALEKSEEIVEIWETAHGKIESFTPHEEMDELEEIIKSLPVYARQGNMERLEEKTEIAIGRLDHIIKNETPLISNIF